MAKVFFANISDDARVEAMKAVEDWNKANAPKRRSGTSLEWNVVTDPIAESKNGSTQPMIIVNNNDFEHRDYAIKAAAILADIINSGFEIIHNNESQFVTFGQINAAKAECGEKYPQRVKQFLEHESLTQTVKQNPLKKYDLHPYEVQMLDERFKL